MNTIIENFKPIEINSIYDLANLLNGNEYGDELKNDIIYDVEGFCRDRNWLIVFPYSDDNIELRGIYDDEFGAYNGTTIRFIKKGNFYMDDNDEECYHKAPKNMFTPINNKELIEISKELGKYENHNGLIINALWAPEGLPGYSWAYHILGNVNYAEFDIIEDDFPFAKCLIIDMNNLLK